MNKRIFAMLMALAMIISMVPMTALAAEDHDCEGGAWQPNGDVTHSSYCKVCGEVVDTGNCQSINGKTCYMCKGSMTAEPEEPACAHTGVKSYLYKDADVHEVYCYECKELYDGSEAHTFTNGTCNFCGAIQPYIPEEPVCDHEGGAWISNGDGTHTSSCECGVNTTTGDCQDLGSGKCYMCGYVFPVDAPECDHEGGAWISNGDGTHSSSCECGEYVDGPHPCQEINGKCYMCGYEFHKCTMDELVSISETQHQFKCECGEFVGAPMNHYDNDGDNDCDGCGYTMYVLPECDHEGGAWISNGDGTHTSKCECGEYVDGPHPCQEINGKCYMCGYKFHECSMDELVSISETQHQFKCECGEFVGAPMNHYDNDGDRFCDGCKYEMYEEVKCDHEGGAWISNGDGTHTSKCECGEYVDGPHPCYDLGSGKCYMCGYEFPVEEECNHEGGAWISNGDGTHTSKCECGEYVDGPHPCYDLGKGECYMCGYKFPVEEPECKHEWKGVVNNGVPGVHSIVCRDCLETLGAESHLFVDGRPCACGAIYVEETECKHEWKGVVNNGDATHNVVCRDCLEVLDTESHMFVDGRPCACGAIYIHDHDYEAGVTSNEDGTHNVNCSCGEFVAVACSDGNGDGKCDSCDYQMYPVHECDFEAGVTSNEDGTHNVNCSCGEFVTVDCLDNDGDDKCDSCGYQMYEHECEHDYKCVFYNEDIIKNVCKHCGDVEIESNAYYKLWQWCYDHGIKLGNNWWKYAGPWLNMFK